MLLKYNTIISSLLSPQPIMVTPPILPKISCHGHNSTPGDMTPTPPDTTSLDKVLEKRLPQRIELMEGYMSNHISHITFSTSDMLNVHLLKKQEVRHPSGIYASGRDPRNWCRGEVDWQHPVHTYLHIYIL